MVEKTMELVGSQSSRRAQQKDVEKAQQKANQSSLSAINKEKQDVLKELKKATKEMETNDRKHKILEEKVEKAEGALTSSKDKLTHQKKREAEQVEKMEGLTEEMNALRQSLKDAEKELKAERASGAKLLKQNTKLEEEKQTKNESRKASPIKGAEEAEKMQLLALEASVQQAKQHYADQTRELGLATEKVAQLTQLLASETARCIEVTATKEMGDEATKILSLAAAQQATAYEEQTRMLFQADQAVSQLNALVAKTNGKLAKKVVELAKKERKQERHTELTAAQKEVEQAQLAKLTEKDKFIELTVAQKELEQGKFAKFTLKVKKSNEKILGIQQSLEAQVLDLQRRLDRAKRGAERKLKERETQDQANMERTIAFETGKKKLKTQLSEARKLLVEYENAQQHQTKLHGTELELNAAVHKAAKFEASAKKFKKRLRETSQFSSPSEGLVSPSPAGFKRVHSMNSTRSPIPMASLGGESSAFEGKRVKDILLHTNAQQKYLHTGGEPGSGRLVGGEQYGYSLKVYTQTAEIDNKHQKRIAFLIAGIRSRHYDDW